MDTALAIFAYRRADKLIALHDAIAEWEGPIHIFCDGARGDEDREDVFAVREVALNFGGSASITERESNFGLSRNLREGITETLSRHESVIVLEDDILPRAGCLDFFTWALEQARDRCDIFSVSAYHPLGLDASLPELFLSQRFLCWGWATWADRWEKVTPALASGEPPWKHYWQVPESGGDDLRWSLRSHRIGRKPVTWAHLTSMHCLSLGLKHLCPRTILMDNVGFDGTGENCSPEDGVSQNFLNKQADMAAATEPPQSWPESLTSNAAIEARIASQFRQPREPALKRLRRYLSYRFKSHTTSKK